MSRAPRWLRLLPLLACLVAPAAAAAPRQVLIGAYLNDIQNLELKSHSYAVDLYLWFRWKDATLDPANSLEFMNPYELWGHSRVLSYPSPLKLPSGELYQVVRVQGRFSRKLPLNDYPFDRQTLEVSLEDSLLDSTGLEYETTGVTVNPALSLPGFRLGAATFESGPNRYATDFGDFLQPGKSYSRVTLSLPIERPALAYSVKLLLPILCVVFCSSLMFLFHPKHVDSRVGIGITALLTIVALQITLNADLPEVDYLVLMDKVYLGAYIFVIAGLAVVVYGTWRLEEGQAAREARLERKLLAGMLGVYLLSMAALVLPKVLG